MSLLIARRERHSVMHGNISFKNRDAIMDTLASKIPPIGRYLIPVYVYLIVYSLIIYV